MQAKEFKDLKVGDQFWCLCKEPHRSIVTGHSINSMGLAFVTIKYLAPSTANPDNITKATWDASVEQGSLTFSDEEYVLHMAGLAAGAR